MGAHRASSSLRLIRNVAWLAVLLSIALLAPVGLGWWRPAEPAKEEKNATRIVKDLYGGPFTLKSHTGSTFTEKNLRGRPTLLFFGFTSCPDICPTTLTDVVSWLEAIGPESEKVQVAFVTVDPERDTIEIMADYVTSFDKRIVGLTGSADQLEAAAKAWRVYYQKVLDGAGGYVFDHTATIYMVDIDGRLFGTIDRHDQAQSNIDKIRRLLLDSGGGHLRSRNSL